MTRKINLKGKISLVEKILERVMSMMIQFVKLVLKLSFQNSVTMELKPPILNTVL